MKRYVEGEDRSQAILFPERLDDYIAEDNPVRAIDVFVDELDLLELGFEGMEPEATGRPAYHPATLLKIYCPFSDGRGEHDSHCRARGTPTSRDTPQRNAPQ